ncbi:tetratricopeptide repeat protein [Leptolyngbya sp. FACHB-541]|uniref:nSTAND1 domain-containing NTPase n=1 Tax=Leptolyngbya sp. FACHB-541 TaxID=2692810 RepID=UPI001688357A|nr:tetratricopeptide repeat protein [Leptolyngbya sp. FACHB-541]MBD1997935.1 tetratricopeptide repeat protein [Leptolyngbya sp. FACHB-541]
MSNPSPAPVPPTDAIKETTEKLAAFVQWIAQLIQSRSWFTILLLLDVVLLFAANPGVATKLLTTFFPQQTLPEQYPGLFWLTLGLIFVVALVVAVRTMPQPAADATDFTERKAIKGLRPFSAEDAEIFAQLQRNRSLKECLESITSSTFRFGILMGESGSGKTSFLQAGLLPKLSTSQGAHRAVYVKFADRPPIDTIRSALSEQLKLPKEKVATADLLTLLNIATEAIAKPLILLFDQFEQFFVHHKHRSDRQPFIQALTDWYGTETLAVKIVVCIRGDMCDRLVELHQALGYSLGPQEVFRLEKFTPIEAAKVLRVIADTEDLQFDDRFVAELAEQELANREDGLISPVDLQILAWMIQRQTVEELRAFNRTAFQKFGGVEGLMTRFLERTLDARMIKAQREAAVKVLLALTDLERNARAGVLTITELQTKLQNTVKPEEVEEAASWLARSDVRLITPIEHTTSTGDTTGYELAHERIIPALMRLAGQELKAADRANQLLDRRVNEWLGNQRNSRYLLTWRELWMVRLQKPYLVWGAQHRQKAQLLHQSYRRIYQSATAVALVTLLTIASSGWLLYIPQGQIQRVRWELASPLHRVEDEQVAEAAIAFAKDERWRHAFDIVKKHISDPDANVQFLSDAATASAKFANSNIAKQILTAAFQVSQTLEDPFNQAETLSAIAAASGQLKDTNAAKQMLIKALETARTLGSTSVGGDADEESSDDKSETLIAIVQASSQLGDPVSIREILTATSHEIQSLKDPSNQFDVLNTVAIAYGQLGDIDTAKQFLTDALRIQTAESTSSPYESGRFDALITIAGTYKQLGDTDTASQLLADAFQIAQALDDPSDKFDALITVATAYGQLGDADTASQLLADAFQIAQTLDNSSDEWGAGDKLDALSEIVDAVSQLEGTDATRNILTSVWQVAQGLEASADQFDVFIDIATAYGQLEEPDTARQILEAALQAFPKLEESSEGWGSGGSNSLINIVEGSENIGSAIAARDVLINVSRVAQTLEDASDQSDVLSAIAKAAERLDRQLKDTTAARDVLTEVLQAVSMSQNSAHKSYVMYVVASVYLQLQDPDTAKQVLTDALQIAQTIEDDSTKSDALSTMASLYGQLEDTDTARQVLAQALESAEISGEPQSLSSIAVAYANLGDWGEVLRALRRCREEERVQALTEVLTLWAEKRNPMLRELREEEEE